MKGTAMALVLTVASASSCSFEVPPILVQKGARLSHFSCDNLSPSCCSGLEDVLSVKGSGKGMSPAQVMKDTIGTCGRADQVIMYDCAVTKAPQIVPAGKEGKLRQIIKSKGCGNVEVKRTSTDGSGQCSLSKGDHTIQIDGVSTGCCAAGNAVADVRWKLQKQERKCDELYQRVLSQFGNEVADETETQLKQERASIRDNPSVNAKNLCYKQSRQMWHDRKEVRKAAKCGMIGACGKQDQLSIKKFVETLKGNPFKDKAKSTELLLLETFNFPVGGPTEMMASFMPSEVKQTTEDGATDDGSQIMTGLLGFVAGAAVTGLGVTVLRRRTPSQDEYSEIVA